MSYRKPGDLELGRIIGSDRPHVLPWQHRDKHLYICGSTGVGKSKFIERLIRQDIVDWPRKKAGLLLIDPHGAIYDGLVKWLAQHDLKRPIVPIDLRRDDWIPSYNVLRKRAANPAVIVDNFIAAVAHVWGQSGTDQTPLFAQWGADTIRALYEKEFSLVEAVHLTDRSAQALRRFMTTGLTDPLASKDWEYANGLQPRDFDAQIGSTLRRLARFVRTDLIRAILGQTEASLDFGEVLDQGHIVLVSLAREGAKVSKEDADLFATLLLTDLWTAAQERGKPIHAKDAKRFYVYVDEFSRFVTPTMAEQLAEARGFGLCLTMAQQFPRQLISQGAHGERLFDEVMENASTKVVFRMQDTNNLKPLAEQLFLGTFDTRRKKLEIYATRVTGYRKEMRQSRSAGHAESFGHADGYAQGEGHALGLSHGSSEGYSESRDDPSGDLRAWNESFGESSAETDTSSRFASSSRSDSHANTTSESTTESVVDVPILGRELSSVQFLSLEEQLFQSMQSLFVQQDRQCAVRAVGTAAPLFLHTFDVATARASITRSTAYLRRCRERWPFFIPMTEAVRRIAQREQVLLASVFQHSPQSEPTTARRRLKSGPDPS